MVPPVLLALWHGVPAGEHHPRGPIALPAAPSIPPAEHPPGRASLYQSIPPAEHPSGRESLRLSTRHWLMDNSLNEPADTPNSTPCQRCLMKPGLQRISGAAAHRYCRLTKGSARPRSPRALLAQIFASRLQGDGVASAHPHPSFDHFPLDLQRASSLRSSPSPSPRGDVGAGGSRSIRARECCGGAEGRAGGDGDGG